MRLLLLLPCLAVGCASLRPELVRDEESSLRRLLDSAGIEPSELVAYADAGSFATSARVSRAEVFVADGHVRRLRIVRGRLRDMNRVAAFPELEELDLSRNAVERIEGVGRLVHLRALTLAGNRIDEMGGLSGAPALETLNLARNEITRIDGLDAVPRLRRLCLAGNPLRSIDGLRGDDLADVDLSFTDIRRLDGIEWLPRLVTLNIWHTHVERLGPVYVSPSLRYIGAGEAPLDWSDVETLHLVAWDGVHMVAFH